MSFAFKQISASPDVIAPDGSEVRVLCHLDRGSLAVFTLPPGSVSKAVVHRTVDEIWYFMSGSGQMWLRQGEVEEVFVVQSGSSISIPVGTRFQFRSDAAAPLVIIGATMPRWPEAGDADIVEGQWQPTV